MSDQIRPPIRLRLTGRGGQGIMLAGAILAEAAMYDGQHVTETQEYGPEARLGATKADVILSDREIAFPEVTAPDMLLCLSRDGFLRYGRTMAAGGLCIVEASLRRELGNPKGLVYLPLREGARALGNELVMNMVALGALAARTGVVSAAGLARAATQRVKAELLDLNLRALRAGVQIGQEAGVVSGQPRQVR